MRTKWIFLAPVAFTALLMFAALGAAIVLLLWNWLLPPLFGWRAITFWQALGILALSRILFGGLGLHGNMGSRMRRRIEERWDVLTPEERERIRQRMRERWGFGPAPSETKAQS